MARPARKIETPAAPAPTPPVPVAQPEPPANVANLPVTEEKFAQAFEVFMDARAERDRQEERMDAFKPIIVDYVKANGEHGKPTRPDDAKMEYNGYGVHYQFNPRYNDKPGVAWVKAELAKRALDDPRRAELDRLVVMVPAINRELWESMLERPDSPIPQDVANEVIPLSYKLVVRDLAKKTCEKCGQTVNKTFAFCPKCGTPLAEQFSNAYKAKKSAAAPATSDELELVQKRNVEVKK